MSKQAVIDFLARGDLEARLPVLNTGVTLKEALGAIVAAGAECGHVFTAEELDAEFAEMARGELSDAQLETAAGGAILPYLEQGNLFELYRNHTAGEGGGLWNVLGGGGILNSGSTDA